MSSPIAASDIGICLAGGVFGLYVALTGKRMPGGAIAMAQGNALGKGPVVFHLFDSGIEYIRNQAAGNSTWLSVRLDNALSDPFITLHMLKKAAAKEIAHQVTACLATELAQLTLAAAVWHQNSLTCVSCNNTASHLQTPNQLHIAGHLHPPIVSG